MSAARIAELAPRCVLCAVLQSPKLTLRGGLRFAVQVFIRNEGEAAAAMTDAPDEGAEGSDGVRTSELSTEYDVFKCDAYEEEMGKWIRLMPDADFIPT